MFVNGSRLNFYSCFLVNISFKIIVFVHLFIRTNKYLPFKIAPITISCLSIYMNTFYMNTTNLPVKMTSLFTWTLLFVLASSTISCFSFTWWMHKSYHLSWHWQQVSVFLFAWIQDKVFYSSVQAKMYDFSYYMNW